MKATWLGYSPIPIVRGNSSVWTYTYTVDLPAFTLPADAASTVNCPADANVQPAGPGVITDLCGNTLTPVITAPAAVACEGDMVWTFTYTDCAANTADWTYTYTVDMPTFAIATPSGASTVNCPADANIQPADAGVVTDLWWKCHHANSDCTSSCCL